MTHKSVVRVLLSWQLVNPEYPNMDSTCNGSFEKKSSVSSGEIPKFPIQRLEPAIQKFVKVIDIDLDRLHKHRLNIEKYSRLQDWNSLNKEQINTTRTVQQIVTNIKEIEKTRRQVQEDDLEKFDTKIKHMKETALASVKEFVEIHMIDDNGSHVSSEDANLNHPLLPDKHNRDQDAEPLSGIQQLQTKPDPQETETSESWENLHQSLQELNTMVHHFSTEVHAQQEKIDNIEDNIESAHENINKGTQSLGQASKYKAAILPVAGALIGTVVAGPVGLIAGAKIGGMAAIGGGMAGYAGGQIVKRRQDNITNIEMSNLSQKSETCCDQKSPSNSWLPWNWS